MRTVLHLSFCCRYSLQRGRQSHSGRIERRQLCRISIHATLQTIESFQTRRGKSMFVRATHSFLSLRIQLRGYYYFSFSFRLIAPSSPFAFAASLSTLLRQPSKWPKSRPLSTFACFHVGSSSKSAMSRVIMAGVNRHWRVIHLQWKAVSIR